MAAIEFSDVTLGYDRHPAVHHLSGKVEAGSLTAVVGPNGAGKSTLFKGITGTLKPLAGHIDRNGFGVRDIAYLPQVAEIDRSFPITVYDMVAMGLWRRTGPFGGVGRKDHAAIAAGLAAVGGADAAFGVRPPAAPGRADDRARGAVCRHRRQNHGRPAAPHPPVARR